jgi:outer membrane receptor protein involved in Fe transport
MNHFRTATLFFYIGFYAYAEEAEQQFEKISIHGHPPISTNDNEYYLLGSIQQIDSATLRQSNTMSLTEQMNSSLASLNVNGVQNNPVQPDLQYRGFTASPLLGLPQGLSVYLNGVRFNELFGDTVNWDLFSLSSIDNVTLYSGSNPIFGQNTLGGALSLTTKNCFGFDHNEVAANDNKMIGNGAVPLELLSLQSSTAIYTQPDQTKTQLGMIGLNLQKNLSSHYSLNSNVYYRHNKIASINGEDSDYDPCMFNGGISLCQGDDEGNINDITYEELDTIIFKGFGETIGLSDLTSIDAEEIDGTRHTGTTDNSSYGFTAQLARQDSFGEAENEFIIGIGADKASIDFSSDTEFAILHNDTIEDDRSVSGIGFYDSYSMIKLKANTSHHYLYLINSIQLDNGLAFSLASRYNKSKINMNDLIESGPGSLDGLYKYHRFNPAISLSYNGIDNLTLKASYSQSSRTPSPAELSCADEEDPCKLPNGFVSNPPLDQVVVTTAEVGAIYNQPNRQVNPRDSIPGQPKHQIKLSLQTVT